MTGLPSVSDGEVHPPAYMMCEEMIFIVELEMVYKIDLSEIDLTDLYQGHNLIKTIIPLSSNEYYYMSKTGWKNNMHNLEYNGKM